MSILYHNFIILDYLKKNLNVSEFNIYLVDSNKIKVTDKNDEVLYFSYDKENKNVVYEEEIKELDRNNGDVRNDIT